MTTTSTSHLQQGNNTVSSNEEYSQFKKNYSNPRYPYATTHFVAGDMYQFKYYCESNLFESDCKQEADSQLWELYSGTEKSMFNTVNYMFYKFKKGTYIQMRDGKMQVFLPFSNYNYQNEWSDKIQGKHNLQYDLQCNNRTTGLKSRQKKIIKINEPRRWYANNGIFRHEFPPSESMSGLEIMNDMFHVLCETYNDIPNVQFCLNKRDFPLLRKDECEPYNYIFGDGCPLVSHKYDSYIPILSMAGNDEFADILIPTWDDWARVNQGVCNFPHCPQYFSELNSEEIKEVEEVEWNDKIATAFFRGSSTGFGVSKDSNPRLRLVHMSQTQPFIDGEPLFLDAGITKWNCRPRIDPNTKKIVFFNQKDILPTSKYTSYLDQKQFKYTIYVEGHVCAFRLPTLLDSGSLVMFVESKFSLWFTHLLVPFQHYIPVKADLSDLYEKIQWARDHDSECQQIVKNAKEFVQTHLSKESILKYLRFQLIRIAIHFGSYRNESLSSNFQELLIKEKSFGSTFNYIHNQQIIANQCSSSKHFVSFDDDGEPKLPSDSSSLTEMIKCSNFNWIKFTEILKQVILIYQRAYNAHRFVHHNATPSNILITSHGIFITDYRYSTVSFARAGGAFLPDKGIYIGTTDNPQEYDWTSDAQSIIISSLYMVLCHQRLDKPQMTWIFNIASNLNSKYFSSVAELKQTLEVQSRYPFPARNIESTLSLF